MSRDEMKDVFTPEKMPEAPPQNPFGRTAMDRILGDGPTFKVEDVSEIGAVPITPAMKGQSVKSEQKDPVDAAKERARERSQEKGQDKAKSKEIEI